MVRVKKPIGHKEIKEESAAEPTTIHTIPQASHAVVLRVPRLNAQIIILSLIALITLLQTFQLIRISSKASTAIVKTTPASVPSSNTPGGSSADEPQSMVGGC